MGDLIRHGSAVPPFRGPAGPFSLKTVHRTVFRALEPPLTDLPEILWISGRQIRKEAIFALVDKLPATKMPTALTHMSPEPIVDQRGSAPPIPPRTLGPVQKLFIHYDWLNSNALNPRRGFPSYIPHNRLQPINPYVAFR